MARCPVSCFAARIALDSDATTYGGSQVKRREFITMLGGAATWPVIGRAQYQGNVARIGFLGNSTAALEANLVEPFRDGLRALGYEEGRNIVIEYRWAEGNYERFPLLVAELLALKVDVIVTAGTPATVALQTGTTSVPLVMVAVGDPIGSGLVASLARPGGNLTGLSSIAGRRVLQFAKPFSCQHSASSARRGPGIANEAAVPGCSRSGRPR
jgi:putative ABC transport system substrate-binding protein